MSGQSRSARRTAAAGRYQRNGKRPFRCNPAGRSARSRENRVSTRAPGPFVPRGKDPAPGRRTERSGAERTRAGPSAGVTLGRAAARSGSRSAGGKRARCEPRLTQRGRAVGRSSPTPPLPPPAPLPEPLRRGRSPRAAGSAPRPPRRSPDLVGASHAVHGGCSAGPGAAPGSPSGGGRSLGRCSALPPILPSFRLFGGIFFFFSLPLLPFGRRILSSLFLSSPPSLPPNPSCATAAPGPGPPRRHPPRARAPSAPPTAAARAPALATGSPRPRPGRGGREAGRSGAERLRAGHDGKGGPPGAPRARPMRCVGGGAGLCRVARAWWSPWPYT